MTNLSSQHTSKTSRTRKQGLVKEILLVVIALIILGYFGFDIEKIIHSDLVQKNLMWLWQGIKSIWHAILGYFGF